MTKLWGQMKGMVDRLAEAEKSKHELEAELTRLTSQYRHQEAAKDMHHAETVAVTTTLSKVQQRAQAAEKKIPELQTELDQTSLRLQATEVQLKDYGALRVELQDRRDEIVRLKSQIQDDKLQRSVMAQQIDDLRQQGKASREIEDRLRKENQELKDELLAIQTKLHYAEDTSRSVSDKHNLSEQSRSSLLQQVGNLQAERDNLSQELTRISNQLDAQIRKGLRTTRTTWFSYNFMNSKWLPLLAQCTSSVKTEDVGALGRRSSRRAWEEIGRALQTI
nr:tropomyosin-like [Lytechinus pictus]